MTQGGWLFAPLLLLLCGCTALPSPRSKSGRSPIYDAPEADYDVPPRIIRTPAIDSSDFEFEPGRHYVVVEVGVGADGTVESVGVLHSDHVEFERVLVESMWEAVFLPAIRDEEPVSARIAMPFILSRDPPTAEEDGG